jgi:iron-sulfur cluster assembly protein
MFEWSDSDPRPEDKVLAYEHEGTPVRVFVDPKSYVFLDGSTLDYATTLMARGFKWINPNAKGTCGCGESVQF